MPEHDWEQISSTEFRVELNGKLCKVYQPSDISATGAWHFQVVGENESGAFNTVEAAQEAAERIASHTQR